MLQKRWMYVWDVRPAADGIDPQTDIIITFASYIMSCPSRFTVYIMSIVGSCQCHKDPYQKTHIRQYPQLKSTSHYLHFYVHAHSCYLLAYVTTCHLSQTIVWSQHRCLVYEPSRMRLRCFVYLANCI